MILSIALLLYLVSFVVIMSAINNQTVQEYVQSIVG